MWRRKKKDSKAQARPFPGISHALDGHTALWATESMVSDAIVVESAAEFAGVTGRLKRLVPRDDSTAEPAVHVLEAGDVAATTAGYATSGLRSAGLVIDGSKLRESLYAAAGKRLPEVFHLTCRATRRQAGALRSGHDEYHDLADTGSFQFFAQNVQQVVDFALIARRVAELTLTPGVCAQDLYATSHSVQPVLLPESGLINAYLGRSGDMIKSPTSAQELLFGRERRRVPAWTDVDRPSGAGGFQDQDSYFKAMAAQHVYFADALPGAVDQAMEEFEALTGRHYDHWRVYRVHEADYIVVAQGDAATALEPVVDYLREKHGARVGVLGVTFARPFPGPGLTQLLKGRKAITILERTDRPLAEDLPICREIRSAIDKAAENGVAGPNLSPPYPGYATYDRPSDRPAVYAGVYGSGTTMPSPAELAAVFANMMPAGAGKRRFFVGVDFAQPTHRFPHLHTLQQALSRSYPRLTEMSAPSPVEVHAEGPGAIDVYSLSGQGGLFAGNLFTQALIEGAGLDARSLPDGGLERSLQAARFTLMRSEDGATPLRGVAPRTVVLSDHRMLDRLDAGAVASGGTVVIGANLDGPTLWREISTQAARWIREHKLAVWFVDARRIASGAASQPSFLDQLAVWALLAAGVKSGWQLSEEAIDASLAALRDKLELVFGKDNGAVEDIVKSARAGASELTRLDWEGLEREDAPAESEHTVPWAVAESSETGAGVFDVSRFWRSVGYLYDSGRSGDCLVDPYVATGLVPARSSAFRDVTPYRLRIPEWQPANCTGCGLCWTHCPESSLPPTVQGITGYLQGAIDACAAAGDMLIQMVRLRDPVAKQAHRLVAGDGLHQYTTLGPLFSEAFARTAEKLGLKDKALEAASNELGRVLAHLAHYPVARTDVFFEARESANKGDGELLSIALNPLSCTGCGLCIEVCPDDAIAWQEQTPGLLKALRDDWQFQMSLPAPNTARYVDNDRPDTQVNRFLDARAYHTLVGGDGSFAGSSAKMALRLVTGTVESVMRPRFEKHVERLTVLIGRIEDAIQNKVSGAVKINDFEAFRRRLERLSTGGDGAESIGALVGESGVEALDAAWLKRLADHMSALQAQRELYTSGSTGNGRSTMVLTVDADEVTFWSGTYPFNPHANPWIAHLPGDAFALAEGVAAGMVRRVADEIKAVRIAELELDGRYDPGEHERVLGWEDLEPSEQELVAPVVVITKPGTAAAHVSRLANSPWPLKVALIDTEGMSQTVDVVTRDRGAVYAAQSSVGDAAHLIDALRRGCERGGAAVFHIYAPDLLISGIGPEEIVDHARRASRGRAFPLFRVDATDEGKSLSLDGNPDPGAEWSVEKVSIRRPSGEEIAVEITRTVADWAFADVRWRERFKVVAMGSRAEHMKPLAEYLALEEGEREAFEPYIEVVGEGQRMFLAVVPPDVVSMAESRMARWRHLRESAAGGRPSTAPTVSEAPRPAEKTAAAAPAPATDAAIVDQLTERLLVMCGYKNDPGFFKQSLRNLVGDAPDESVSDD